MEASVGSGSSDDDGGPGKDSLDDEQHDGRVANLRNLYTLINTGHNNAEQLLARQREVFDKYDTNHSGTQCAPELNSVATLHPNHVWKQHAATQGAWNWMSFATWCTT